MKKMVRNPSLEDIYPQHFMALKNAKLLTNKISMLKEEILKLKEKESKLEKESKNTKLKERNRQRSPFFCIGYSKAWLIPIHQTIKEVKKKFKLGWLRVSMSYHRYTNLREIFQGDLSRKLTLDVTSKDFKTLVH